MCDSISTRIPRAEPHLLKLYKVFSKNPGLKLSMSEIEKALAQVDKELVPLPQTAQVAAQQGAWLGRRLAEGGEEGGFRYKHFGNLAYVGGMSFP